MALRIGQPTSKARELLRMHRQTYLVFWDWVEAAVGYAMLHGRLYTVFGWTVHVETGANPRFLQNFPMQANGAEMLRLGCILGTERGIDVCAPVHDAVLIEAPCERIEQDVAAMQAAMAEASRHVLGGFELRSDATIVGYPERYMDQRGATMWDRVTALLDESERPSCSLVSTRPAH